MVYNTERHEYSENGVIVPSVTQILYRSTYNPWFTKESSDRGHEAHRLCAEYARDPQGFPAEPYVDSFALWSFRNNPQWIKIEEMLDGKVDGFRYAGTLDGLAIIDGKLTLVDWKTGVVSRKFLAQLGGYSLAEKPLRGLVLYLRDDMTYKEHWLTSMELARGIQDFREAIREYYAQKN